MARFLRGHLLCRLWQGETPLFDVTQASALEFKQRDRVLHALAHMEQGIKNGKAINDTNTIYGHDHTKFEVAIERGAIGERYQLHLVSHRVPDMRFRHAEISGTPYFGAR